jgi:proteasome assembly chaperone (PAC2) family protein
LRTKIWVDTVEELKLENPVAVAGSPGLRSVGKIVIDRLIESLKPKLFAKLYSYNFPVIYQTKPSYASHPAYPGQGGITTENGETDLPKVEFYASTNPNLIITRGYHPNFSGQYEVADGVIELYQKLGVKRLIILAGYAQEGGDVCCAATNSNLLETLRDYDVEKGYVGPFLGFSGLVLGMAMLHGIEGICLFGRTQPNLDEPEYPDPKAAEAVIKKLEAILKVNFIQTKPMKW